MPVIARRMLLILVMAFFGIISGVAQPEMAHDNLPEEKVGKEASFDAGEFIFDHVLDAYYWHIATYDEIHITLPLPVILYSNKPELHNGQRFHVFMSSKFNHGHQDYRGFRISEGDVYKGKIVELDKTGREVGRPIDISITRAIAGSIISAVILFVIVFMAAKMARKNKGKAPSGMQNLLEPVVIFIRDEIAKSTIGEEKYEQFMPSLLTLFFFILFNNLIGLVPIIGANVTGNIAVTMVLALFTFLITSIKGNKHYWKEIFNPDVPWWLKFPIPLMPIVELSGVFTKPFVLMIRLFANMLAGHMVVAVFISLIFIFASIMGPVAGYGVSLISVTFSVFIVLLDVLVSFIQAYVFTLLSAIYFGMAVADDH